jgi:hypothetical protein
VAIRSTLSTAGRRHALGACVAAAALTLVGAPSSAQPPPAQQRSPAPRGAPSPAADAASDREARAARTALERGDAAGALAGVEPILAREPAHPVAAAVKVQALLGLGQRVKALDAYDAWVGVVRAEDVALLNRIAAAELEALQAEPLLEVDALAALAARPGSQGTAARSKLKELATATPPTARSWPAIVALCRLGDAAAAARAIEAYKQSVGSGRVTALEAVIAAGGARAEATLRDALGTRDAMIQSVAADGAASLGLKSLVPDLQRVARDGEMFGRFSAAVALAELGAPGGEALIEAAATSPAMDARLKAARARKARGDKGWVEAVRPLLESSDVAVKYQAAGLLLAVDRATAMKTLQAGTVDPNPAVRMLVADVLGSDGSVPIAELRRLLRDGIPRVRLFAASALVRRAAAPPR